MAAEQVPLVAEYADVLQIGARNMQNFALLQAAGRRCGKPVLLKRGLAATLEEFLLAAEYILAQRQLQRDALRAGHPHLRDHTRNTLDRLRGAGAQGADAPAGGGRPEPRHRQAQPGAGDGPRPRWPPAPTG